MKKGIVLSIVFLCLFSTTLVFAESTAETYLQELHNQGKERVIVRFENSIDTALINQYGGTVIRTLQIINAVVCEIPQENIELLRQEENVTSVSIDSTIQAQPDGEERDPQELAAYPAMTEQYFTNIGEEYNAGVQQATDDFMEVWNGELAQMRAVLAYYQSYIDWLEQMMEADSSYWIVSWHASLVASRNAYLETYNARVAEVLAEYNQQVALAEDAYAVAQSEWEEPVHEMVVMAFTGSATVHWNNLEAGLNSKAAWDNYDLDGTGIKIAILDSGINYTMENLDDNYLGGYDFADGDADPINPDDTEIHGTEVASLVVGEGVNKIVGVAYNASYYALRVLEGPNPPIGFVSDIIAAIEWSTDPAHKADIISMSIASYGLEPGLREAYRDACDAAYDAGVVLVAGSGNRAYTYSGDPAAFINVISVGGHAEDQTLYINSNGGVDIIAPGARVPTVHPDNSGWWVYGTSFATPHASGLIALQLQYARENNIEVNNGYLWEVMKHSAVDTPPITDPVYKGNGKVWAAETIPAPPEPNDGSIDCMAANWPIGYDFLYSNYVFLLDGLYPAYYIGTNMEQDITLTNNTDSLGQFISDIEELNVTTTQAYYQHQNEDILPGDAIETFPTETLDSAAQIVLPDTYLIPINAYPGLDRTILDMQFEFVGDAYNRLIQATYQYASLWCPPEEINIGFPIGIVALFNGDNAYIKIPDTPDINNGIHQKRTVSVKFKVNDKDITSRKQVLYEEGGGTRGLNLYVYGGKLYIGGWDKSDSHSGWDGTFLSTADIESGTWHHATLVLDGTETLQPNALKGYLDGVEFGSGEGSQLWSHLQNIGIGGIADGTFFHDGTTQSLGNRLAGAIDAVAIYNKALSDSEVIYITENQPTINDVDLVAYYTFDDGTATDHSIYGENNDGILKGTVTFEQVN